MRQSGEVMRQSCGGPHARGFLLARVSACGISRGLCAPLGGDFLSPPPCIFNGNLTHKFAILHFVTLPIGLQNWNHRFAVNFMPEGGCALREVTWALDLGAMPNPNKGDEFNQWPRYALCYGHFMIYVTQFTANLWFQSC